eukprot:SAG22_NODE_676_length_7962_cov_75.623681_3_plen_145_part_00
MLCVNKLAAPKCIVLIHTHVATACFFVLDAERSAELRIPPKEAVEDVKGATAARGGGGAAAAVHGCSVPIFFLVRQEESDLLMTQNCHRQNMIPGMLLQGVFANIVKFALAKVGPCIRVLSHNYWIPVMYTWDRFGKRQGPRHA